MYFPGGFFNDGTHLCSFLKLPNFNIQWKLDFSNHVGKNKLPLNIGVKLLYLTGERKLSLVRIVENLEKPRSRNQDSTAHMLLSG